MLQKKGLSFLFARLRWRSAAATGIFLLLGLAPILAACSTSSTQPGAVEQQATTPPVSLFLPTSCHNLQMINPGNGSVLRVAHLDQNDQVFCLVPGTSAAFSTEFLGSTAAAANGIVYVAGDVANFTDTGTPGVVFAFDIATGTLKWKAFANGSANPPANGKIFGQLALANGLVYFGSVNHHMLAINASTGKPVWDFATHDAVVSSPTVGTTNTAHDTVFFGSNDRHVYAIDAFNGLLRWSFPTRIQVETKPAIGFQGTVLVTDGLTLYALDPKNGTLKWSLSSPDDTTFFSSPTFGLVDGKPRVFVGTSVGVLAVDATNGAKVWEKRLGAPVRAAPTCACDGASLLRLVVNVDGLNAPAGVYLLDPHNGDIRAHPLTNGGASRPTLFNGHALVTIEHQPRDNLVSVNLTTGQVEWRWGPGVSDIDSGAGFSYIAPVLGA
ncbi:MAG TPA: PQQ-binding-like beta-propeller repeat protein [Ktedonobacterales bacterium]|jgi:outer membrane protein assembly factor BamB